MRKAMARAWGAGAIALLGVLAPVSCGRRGDPAPEFASDKVPGCDIVVARVNGEPITAGEVYQKIRVSFPMILQSGPGLGAQAKEIIKALVDERCLAGLARATGDDQDPDYRLSLYFARLSLLAQVANRNQITNRLAPSAAWVDSFYQANKERLAYKPQVSWSQIQVGSEAEARRVIAEVRSGADFAELARRVSKDKQSAGEGGRMPLHPQGPIVAPFGSHPELDAALFALQPGEVSGPVRTSFGWHILKVETRREGREPSLDEVRQQVVAKVVAQREGERTRAVLDSLKAAYRVEVDEQALDRFRRLQMNEEDLFKAAQAEKEPSRQLAYYQEIRARYPTGARAAEALFMIGFVSKEELNQLPQAREALERFLEEYPEHPLAASARTLLDEVRRGVGSSATGG
jgi:peptidyl-prolyl cis-trans isomerase C